MKYFIMFTYVGISTVLFFFNWDVFTKVYDMNLIFGTYSVMPFFILQVFGGLLLGSFMLWDGFKDLKQNVKLSKLQNKIMELEKNIEIQLLKKDTERRTILRKVTDNDGDLLANG
ncbi:hypothetical protein [Aquimarina latercula]|uniref:hypothetical protein n=1 Tax=Aquimarina latercula TaxID=987 RepID=UPI0005542A2F|nr:hypothetical protein [Aquimarina latercula]